MVNKTLGSSGLVDSDPIRSLSEDSLSRELSPIKAKQALKKIKKKVYLQYVNFILNHSKRVVCRTEENGHDVMEREIQSHK